MSADRIEYLRGQRVTLLAEIAKTDHSAGTWGTWDRMAALWRGWNAAARVRLMVIDLELRALGVEP